MLTDKLRECRATLGPWNICNAMVFKIHETLKDQARESREHLLKYGKIHHDLLPLASWLPYKEMVVEYDDGVDWYVQDGTNIYYAALLKKSINYAHRAGLKVAAGDYCVFPLTEERKLAGDIQFVSPEKTKNDSRFMAAMFTAYGGLARFLDILSCKNIATELTPPHEKANNKRIKKGRLPLVSFYTLKIQSKIGGSISDGDREKWSNRVHLCRGHMREYGESRPLFGKYTGKFWIPPHARGDKRKGVINKQYELATQQ